MTTPVLDVLADGYAFLETPRWHDERLWAADLYGRQVVRFSPDGSAELAIDVPGTPTGFGWTHDGMLLVLTADGRLLEWDGSRLTARGRPIAAAPATCNEMTVLPDGSICVGIFGLATGGLTRIRPDGSVVVAVEDLLLPNGQAMTPDGQTLVVAESAGQRLTAFAVGANGALSDRREWARFGEPASARRLPEVLQQVMTWPDGVALEAQDSAWVANPFGNEVVRIVEGGPVTHRIATGDLACFACALGGPDGRTLFLCVAPPAADHETRRATRSAGLMACRLDAL
jgi:sugar lactone lactonase YvrE